jgi:anion-transporting  ArsA/GET3 family ATPase
LRRRLGASSFRALVTEAAPTNPAGAPAAATLSGLLDRKLLVLTGKGGTGKSTLSAALALAAASRGKRVLVCEVTARERVSELLGSAPAGTELRQLRPNLWAVHVRPREAMREYGIMTLRSETLYNLVFERKVVRYFLKAAPSLAEITMLGKVCWHAAKDLDERGKPRWDLVILDAPATGHGLTLLSVPEVFLGLVSEGPLATDMLWMQALLRDPVRTAVCVCALPEEMPVNEAIELRAALAQHKLPLGPVFLNSVFSTRFTKAERSSVAMAGPLLAAAGEAVDGHEARAELTVRYREVLRKALPDPIVEVPHQFDRQFGVAALERIGRAIAGCL